jgi:hypothetical protein
MQNALNSINRVAPRLRTLGIKIVAAANAAGHTVAISSDKLDAKREKLAEEIKVVVYDSKTRKPKKSDKAVEDLIAKTIEELNAGDVKRDWYDQAGLKVSLKSEKSTAKASKPAEEKTDK